MSKPRDLEEELWGVYGRCGDVAEAADRAKLELETIKMVLQVRSAGEKAEPHRGPCEQDSSLRRAREAVNGKSA